MCCCFLPRNRNTQTETGEHEAEVQHLGGRERPVDVADRVEKAVSVASADECVPRPACPSP